MLRISYGKIPMKLKDIEIRTAQLFVTIVEYICVETFACFCIYDSKYIAYRLAQYPHGPGHLLFCVEILEITLSSYISCKFYFESECVHSFSILITSVSQTLFLSTTAAVNTAQGQYSQYGKNHKTKLKSW